MPNNPHNDEAALLQLSEYIERKCGIHLDKSKNYLMVSRLASLIAETEEKTMQALYLKLVLENAAGLTEKVINAITTNETTWFREQSPWLTLGQIVLPQLIHQLRAGERFKVRFWSAASSTGQEIYSTVMYVDNYLKLHNISDITLDNFEFYATDINSSVLDIARAGRYDMIAMQRGFVGEFADYGERYFTKHDRYWELDAAIRARVNFSKTNILESSCGNIYYDVIFMRYILIYFSERNKRLALENIQARANEGAVLFFGNSEIIDSDINPFKRIVDNGKVYYCKTGKASWQL